MIHDKNRMLVDRQIYSSCVSLGWFCGTASSLSRLGLRSESGPFDWYFSDYSSVLRLIDNGFLDFMNKGNLKVDTNNPHVFEDVKYHFTCNHDIKTDFEKEYEDIHKKYQKRANRFIKRIKEPTVFFRCICDNNEVQYINENWKYAENVVKKYNSQNCIVYVLRSGLENLTIEVKSYILKTHVYIGKPYEMSYLFNESEELVRYCKGLLSDEVIFQNVEFYKKNNAQSVCADFMNSIYLEPNLDGADALILNKFKNFNNQSFYIWGAGKYGTSLCNYFTQRNIGVKAVIDNVKRGITEDGINIIGPNEIEKDAFIFIAIVDKRANEDIKQQILNLDRRISFLSFEDIYEDDKMY